MADIIDNANDTADMLLAAALRNRKHDSKMHTPAEGIGICLHCGEDVSDPRRWCDAECRDAWQQDADRERK